MEALSVIAVVVAVIGGCGYALFAWYGGSYDRSLLRGHEVIVQISGEETLKQAGFYSAYPEGRPSDVVDFVDGDEGQVQWPKTDREYRDQFAHPDLVDSPGRALMPRDLEFVAHQRELEAGRQIVYVPRDDEGVLDIRGYADDDPLYEWELQFPSDAAEIDL